MKNLIVLYMLYLYYVFDATPIRRAQARPLCEPIELVGRRPLVRGPTLSQEYPLVQWLRWCPDWRAEASHIREEIRRCIGVGILPSAAGFAYGYLVRERVPFV